MQEDLHEMINKIKREEIKYLNFQFMDILGMIKTLTVPENRFESALEEGVVFDGSSVAGYAQIEESDMRAVPDYSTYSLMPEYGSTKVARFVCNVYTPDGKRFPGDPRFALERTLEKLHRKDQEFFVGPEFEFFIFKRDQNGNPTTRPIDYGGYFDSVPMDTATEIMQEILQDLQMLDYHPEAAHHEVSYGQYEIDLRYAPALVMADRISMLKSIIKSRAQRHGFYASFMPKPVNSVNGSGMHVHQSIMSLDESTNYFYDSSDKYGISDLGLHYIAGILSNINAGASILASWVNSYKRLIPGFEAPVYITWANKNRSALIRVPAGIGRRKRFELRCPDPAGNPYLQFAVMLGMGLDGIERRIDPPEPVERDIYHMTPEEKRANNIEPMPESLGEALHHLRGSKLLREILGDHIFNNFLSVKKREWDNYRSKVSDIEVETYLPIL